MGASVLTATVSLYPGMTNDTPNTTPTTPTSEPSNAPTKRARRVAVERMRSLTVSSEVAREEYTLKLLEHLAEFVLARCHGLAYALFPTRSQPAAAAAVLRVLSYAGELGLVEHRDDPATTYRYYALTRKGAAYLNDRIDRPTKAKATSSKLTNLARAAHREWTTMLTVWARLQSGLEAMNEFDLWGTVAADTRERFQAVPDGLTFDLDPAAPVVYWHEMELSRRSQWTALETRKAKDEARRAGKPFRGSGKYLFQSLIWRIHRLRYITNRGREFDIRLVLHCATGQIRRDLASFIELTFQDTEALTYGLRRLDGGDRYLLDYAGLRKGQKGEGFLIILDTLPPSPAKVWHGDGVFPWAGAACYEMRGDIIEPFIKQPR